MTSEHYYYYCMIIITHKNQTHIKHPIALLQKVPESLLDSSSNLKFALQRDTPT